MERINIDALSKLVACTRTCPRPGRCLRRRLFVLLICVFMFPPPDLSVSFRLQQLAPGKRNDEKQSSGPGSAHSRFQSCEFLGASASWRAWQHVIILYWPGTGPYLRCCRSNHQCFYLLQKKKLARLLLLFDLFQG